MDSLGTRLWKRRVPHALGLYAGAATSAVTFADWAATRFGYSPNGVDLLLVATLLLVPTVVYVTYRTGEPEAERWARRHGLTLSCNVVAVVALLGFLFWGKPLGATTRTVVVEGANGERTERTVASDAFRKRVGVFYFDAPAGETWMGQAVAYALVRDLDQDLFLSARCPCSFAERLRKAGFADGAGVPLALAREVAGRFRLDVFATGRVERTAAGVALDVRLTDTQTGRAAGAFRSEGATLVEAVDRAATAYRDALDLPETHLSVAPDLPTGELLTASEPALRAWAEASHAASFAQSAVDAAARYAAAVKADPTFAKAHFDHASVLFSLNDWAAAQKALDAAKAHAYRLAESDRQALRALTFFAARQPQEALEAARQWQSLLPDDTHAPLWVASFAAMQGDLDGAIVAYERVLALDPGEASVHFSVAALLLQQERLDDAAGHYQAYLDAEPDEAAGLQGLAHVERLRGRPADGLALLRRAVVAEPDHVSAHLGLAAALLDTGREAEAATAYERALAAAKTPTERARAFRSRALARLDRGRTRAALADIDSLMIALEGLSDPSNLLAARVELAPRLVEHGEGVRAQASVAAARAHPLAGQPGAFRAHVLTYAALVAAEQGDAAGALATLADAEREMTALGVSLDQTVLPYVRGTAELAARRPMQAARAFAAHARLNAADCGNWVRLARAQAMAGQRREALASAERALAMAPADPRAHLVAARLHAGEPETVRRHLAAALRAWSGADPGFGPAREARALLGRAAPA